MTSNPISMGAPSMVCEILVSHCFCTSFHIASASNADKYDFKSQRKAKHCMNLLMNEHLRSSN
jgi:hypothetical protein